MDPVRSSAKAKRSLFFFFLLLSGQAFPMPSSLTHAETIAMFQIALVLLESLGLEIGSALVRLKKLVSGNGGLLLMKAGEEM